MEALFQHFKIKARDVTLYNSAFTHKTFANEQKITENYQRLEFLGDSILQLKSSLFIYHRFPDVAEGEMTLIRSKNVDTNALANHAHTLNLMQFLRIGKGAEDLLKNRSIMADIFESFVGALYLDRNFKVLDHILKKTIYKAIIKTEINDLKDPKTRLQEYLQSTSRETIVYKLVKEGQEFKATILYDGHNFGSARGKTKKLAETNAAMLALKMLKKEQQ